MDEKSSGGSSDRGGESEELIPRPPDNGDLAKLCQLLNELSVSYVVVGGFAVIHAGYGRFTEDVDLIIDTSLENEARVFQALESLPDQAVKQLDPGDVAKYTVVRVADEIVVDLMRSACGIDYEEASKDIVIREVDGVPIPFASPRLLWRMKSKTHRAKDAPDLVFLRDYFRTHNEEPPEA
ncbi:MAG: nucleotidyltransferase [Verrucomicrobiae bacterium]|nr:nucleotidyltransferase [Verrucomicrobiae bacterium]